jgi:hypothetical protein
VLAILALSKMGVSGGVIVEQIYLVTGFEEGDVSSTLNPIPQTPALPDRSKLHTSTI